MRLSVSRRRSVVKSKFGMSFVFLYALFENIVFVPEIENLLFAIEEIERSVNFFIHNSSECALSRS